MALTESKNQQINQSIQKFNVWSKTKRKPVKSVTQFELKG